MNTLHHLLVNGLSIGSGGGYTVGRELARHLAQDRAAWNVTLALAAGNPLHEQMRGEWWPDNCRLHWAPAGTSGRVARARYESGALADWSTRNGVTRVLQLNGMVIPALRVPTLAHYQDPWPYRREAWTRWKDRVVAYLPNVLVAMFIHFLLTSDALEWSEQWKYLFSEPVLEGVRNTVWLTLAATTPDKTISTRIT